MPRKVNRKGQGVTTSNQLTDAQKVQLWDWMRGHKDTIERDSKQTCAVIAQDATRDLQFSVSEMNVRNAGKVLGIRLKATTNNAKIGMGVQELRAKMEEALDRLENLVKQNQESVVEVIKDVTRLESMIEEVATAPSGTRYRIENGTLRKV